MPSAAASNSGSMLPSPSANWKSLAWPPANSTPSMVPVKSTFRRSPFSALPLARVERRALATQHVERAVDVGRGDVDHRTLDRQAAEVADLHLGIHLEHRRELERAGARVAFALGLDARIARHAQVLLAHGLVEARLHGVGDHVRAHLRAVLLRDHLDRHVARAEARHLDGLGEALQALADFALDLRERHRDAQAPGELIQGLQRALHELTFLAADVMGGAKGGTRTPTGCPASS